MTPFDTIRISLTALAQRVAPLVLLVLPAILAACGGDGDGGGGGGGGDGGY